MPAASRKDPLSSFNVRVEIDGIPVAAFTECSGLSSETEVISYREGADLKVRKLAGLTKFSNIVLKRGVTVDRSLWEWRQSVVNGNIQRKNGSVILLDATHTPIVRWNFFEAWPAKWEGPALNAVASHVAIETLELAHEGLEWVS